MNRLRKGLWLVGAALILDVQPAWANERQPITDIPYLSELDNATTVKEWMTQIAQSPVIRITGVRLNQTAGRVEVILEANGILSPETSVVSNTLIANIPNAVLALADREEFQAANPAKGIALVSVTNLPNNRVRVAITGVDAPPTAEVRTEAQGLVLSVMADELEDEIEIVVTGEQDEGYNPSNATTATRTDTPILDIPQSIQVIPQQVLEDQQVIQLDEALRNVSGVIYEGADTTTDARFSLRGFNNAPVLLDGFRQYNYQEVPETAYLQRIEVLRGPASILFGEIQPGGVINVVPKQPLSEPFYEARLQAGSYGLIRPQIDISGPLTSDGNLLYRLNAVYQHNDSFRNFDQEFERFFIAPVVRWKISDRTNLTLELQYLDRERPYDPGTLAFGDGVVDIPRERIQNEPDDYLQRQFLNVGATLEHKFSNDWLIRSAFRFTDRSTFSDKLTISTRFNEANGIISRVYALDDIDAQEYSLQTNVVGEFSTGSIEHTLLVGVDLNRANSIFFAQSNFAVNAPINIFDPEYGATPRPDLTGLLINEGTETDRLGIYLQDQIEFFDNLQFLVGLRYDTVERRVRSEQAIFRPDAIDTTQNDDALSPRVGIVYKPLKDLSLYASYSQSFNPNTDATSASGEPLEPERGEGYEIGVKAELLGGILATLAYFDITKQNVATADPNSPDFGFSIAAGEQHSRGVEFDVRGEILPGWNIIASYAYIDAEVTEDETIPEGNRLAGIPRHSASLWTTYEIQSGNLKGLGFGIGFYFVDNREGDLDNSFQLGSYFLANAGIFYRRDNWRFALNFKNLFDENYIEGTPFGRLNGAAPGEPFTIIGSISVQL